MTDDCRRLVTGECGIATGVSCELALDGCGMATDVVAAFLLDSSLLPSARASDSFDPGGLSLFTVLCSGFSELRCLLAFLLLQKKTQSATARRRKRRIPTETPTAAVVGSAVGGSDVVVESVVGGSGVGGSGFVDSGVGGSDAVVAAREKQISLRRRGC